jgi:hypothetical protein
MSLLDTILPSETYDTPPLIKEVRDVPEVYCKGLGELRSLLSKYNVPNVLCVRLIHQRFDPSTMRSWFSGPYPYLHMEHFKLLGHLAAERQALFVISIILSTTMVYSKHTNMLLPRPRHVPI